VGAVLAFWLSLPLQDVQQRAIKAEVMDNREVGVLFHINSERVLDTIVIAERIRSLDGAPCVSEGEWLPSREVLNDLLRFNRQYRASLDARWSVDLIHREDVQEMIDETDKLYRVLDAARDYRGEYYYVTGRRESLKKLKELLGDEMWYGHELPPCVPLPCEPK
jgi:hypothetical protein